MAAKGSRSLEETPTWAVAVVCFVILAVSILIEQILHLIGKWLTKRNKKALYEALEKIKSELMLLGFISLLLTIGQGPISEICISKAMGNSWHPCDRKHAKSNYKEYEKEDSDEKGRRKLLAYMDSGKTHARGKVPLVSTDGIHQLHIFIFVLAVFHVLCCIATLALGRAKMRRWKAWEMETRTAEYQYSHGKFYFCILALVSLFARETSFGRRHLSSWSQSPLLVWVVCFFRQFVRSVLKVDYLTLRHGFIIAHLAPHGQTNFDFQNYIKRSLEEDFKVVVGISPPIWLFAVMFLLFNTHGWLSYLWLPFIPLIVILLVGTKLQVIITKMGLKFENRGEIVKGTPIVEPGDDLFWFNRPRILLYLIHFVLFQNSFQLAFFAWAWYEFGMRSCFHEKTEDFMGTNMKPTIFNEKVAKALRTWHHNAKKQIRKNRHLCSDTSLSSRPSIPLHSSSPVHLLRYYKSELDSINSSPPRISNYNHDDMSWSNFSRTNELEEVRGEVRDSTNHLGPPVDHFHHEINVVDFSFEKKVESSNTSEETAIKIFRDA
ncbi:hypothetical protein ACJIZ3_021948 [Penstemon smallii]|uniref:MLO-like protein n=1 Tax=Penstemon smallii TaxID=265156 RepID=A0ABD3SMX7_9LAMI